MTNTDEVKTKKITIKELTESLGEGYDYLMVSSLVKFLVSLGAAKDVGNAPQPTGQRGKPSRVYEIPYVVELQFFSDENEEALPPVMTEEQIVPGVAPVPVEAATNQSENKVDTAENKDNTNDVPEMAVEAKAPMVEKVV